MEISAKSDKKRSQSSKSTWTYTVLASRKPYKCHNKEQTNFVHVHSFQASLFDIKFDIKFPNFHKSKNSFGKFSRKILQTNPQHTKHFKNNSFRTKLKYSIANNIVILFHFMYLSLCHFIQFYKQKKCFNFKMI